MYLTVYKKLKGTGFYKEQFKGDKVTLKLNPVDYKPTPEVKGAMLMARVITWWSNGMDMPEDKASRYHAFQIPKRNGKMRDIKEPIGSTKAIQRNICYKMKTELQILPHDCCHGFVKYRRCLTAMQKHQDNQSNWFLKLDISNFFPSISKELILNTFKLIPQFMYVDTDVREWLADALTDETGHLTQGCISSPYIANLVLLEFDYKFSNWCRKNNLVYTRYADDMCISSRVKFDKSAVVSKVKGLLPEGINLNDEKTKMTSIAGENVFLGIHYNQNKDLTVGYKTKHLMKVMAHKADLGQIPDEERSLWKGRLIYYTSIEPLYFNNSRFDSLRRL